MFPSASSWLQKWAVFMLLGTLIGCLMRQICA